MNQMKNILENFGDDMLDEEIDQIICMSDNDGNGNMNYEEVIIHLKRMAAGLDETLQTRVSGGVDIYRGNNSLKFSKGLSFKHML